MNSTDTLSIINAKRLGIIKWKINHKGKKFLNFRKELKKLARCLN
jgi:hypothetical protein